MLETQTGMRCMRYGRQGLVCLGKCVGVGMCAQERKQCVPGGQVGLSS